MISYNNTVHVQCHVYALITSGPTFARGVQVYDGKLKLCVHVHVIAGGREAGRGGAERGRGRGTEREREGERILT